MSLDIIDTEAVATQSRQDALLESELKIKRATRDTVDSLRIIGRELIKIEEQELYEVMGGNDFQEYVEFHLQFDMRFARQMMRGSLVLDQLERAQLPPPENQSTVFELAKLREPETQSVVWGKVLDFCEKQNQRATYDLVRDAVAAQRGAVLHTRVRSRRTQKTEIDLQADNGEKPSWSEHGQAFLDRIERLCGTEISQAVASGNPRVSENDLELWSDQSNELVRILGYWVVIRRFTVKRALRYEEESVNPSTTVDELRHWCMSRGGKAHFEFPGLHISVESTV
jgi:hypothetical protein